MKANAFVTGGVLRLLVNTSLLLFLFSSGVTQGTPPPTLPLAPPPQEKDVDRLRRPGGEEFEIQRVYSYLPQNLDYINAKIDRGDAFDSLSCNEAARLQRFIWKNQTKVKKGPV